MSLSGGTISSLGWQAGIGRGVFQHEPGERRDRNLKVAEAYGEKPATFVHVRFVRSDIDSGAVCDASVVFCWGVFRQSIVYSLKCL